MYSPILGDFLFPRKTTNVNLSLRDSWWMKLRFRNILVEALFMKRSWKNGRNLTQPYI